MKFLGSLLLGSLFLVFNAQAQTSAFTFQGRLNDGGSPANGLYDFQFWLFDSLADGTGNQIGTQNAPGVQVANGVFSVTLDFGSAAFSGSDRYLQVVVRPSFADPSVIPTILSPRERLTSTPYALRSLSAAAADTATTAASATDSAKLGGVAADQYVLTGDIRLSDSRTPTPGSPNYIQNSTSTQATSNFSISGTGKADTFDAATQFNIAGVRVLGNAGPTNFVAGPSAGQSITIGDSNAFFGPAAGQNTAEGRQNSFFGRNAGKLNTIGSFNAFFGSGSGVSNIDGNNNAFFGFTSGQNNSSGFNNSFFGNAAGLKTTLGGNNSFTGFFAGSNNTIGQQNTFFGASTGATNITGGNNTLFGYGTDVGSANLVNATAIGANARVDAGDSLVLGSINGINGATADTKVGIGTTTPSSRLHVVGDSLFTGNLTVGGTINGTFNGTIQTANNALNLGGVAANQFVQTNDSRLSDARTPTAGSTNYIQNTTSQQTSASFNIGGNGTVSGTLSGNTVNAISQYNINGHRAFSAAGTNVFVGLGATGVNNTSGTGNSFFGFETGGSNTTGSLNAFFGGNAGASTNGSANSFFGTGAGFNTTTGGSNSFFGYNTGGQNATGQGNTFIGAYSATSSNNLTNATAIGYESVVEANDSLVLGSIAGVGGCQPVNNCNDTKVGIGTTTPSARLHVVGDGLFTGNLTVNGSLNANISLNTINAATQYNLGGQRIIGGDQLAGNLFAGFGSGQSLTNGSSNAFFGIEAGKLTDSGSRNSFFGYQAGMSNAGSTGRGFLGHDNSYFGYTAGLRCNGSGNSFFGQGTGLGSGSPPPNDCTGSNNSFFGQNAGGSLTNGQNNSAIGQGAGGGLNSGSFNSFLGAGAGASTIEGSNNTFIGQSSGGFNRTGTDNTAIGSNAWVGGSPATNGLTNATAIGANSCVTASDSLVLGSITNNPNCFIPAGRDTKVGIGTSAPQSKLHVVGDGLFTGNLTVNGTITGNITSGNFIQNSTTQQATSNFNISGNGTAGGTLSGNVISSATQFNIGASRVMSSDTNANVFLGFDAGGVDPIPNPGSQNTFLGLQAGSGLNGGFRNTFVGFQAGQLNTTGTSNTAIGRRADVGANNLDHSTAIGADSIVSSSNTIALGRNSGLDTVQIPGNTTVGGTFSVGTVAPSAKLHVVGDGLFTGNLTVNGTISGNLPSGSTNYIQNTTTQQASTNFNISGTGIVGHNLGVGTAIPVHKLDVLDPLNTGLRVQTNTAGGTVASFGGNGAFQIDASGVDGGRFQVSEDGKVGIGTNQPGEKLEINGNLAVNGALSLSGDKGQAGQVVTSNGPSFSAQWKSPTNTLYQLTNMSSATDQITPGTVLTLVPGLSQTVTVPGNAKLLAQFGIPAFTGACLGCDNAVAEIDLFLNGSRTNKMHFEVNNNSADFMSGSWLMTVGPGSYTIEVKAQNTLGPNIQFGCGPATCDFGVNSYLIVQIIPE